MNNRKTSATQADRRGLQTALFGAGLAALTAVYAPVSLGGATFKIDDTKWVSIGVGLRTSFTATEEAANAGKWSNDFNLDNIRLYLNGQIHEYFKFEFNTDCQTCGDGGEMRILDAIGKFEFHPMFNIWMGRMLVPAERREMNGPFFSAVYNIFGAGTPFEPADFNTTIRSDGTSAGSFGRDDGATIWGSFFDGRLQYAVGFFRGLRNGANADDNLLYAQRFAYNFLDVEKNPGYYTSGTYYGKGGDILTVGVSNQYQEDGAGTRNDPGNFRGTAVDLLFEKPLGNMGVVTINGEYKNYGIKGYSMASRLAGGGFAMFEGDAYDVSAMYLFPQKVWIGQFQPYVRYVNVDPIKSASREVYEAGINYIIDGHNAKIMLMYEYGDLLTKGLDYRSTASGDHVSSIKLGLQLQI
ncbi:hypothetical protein [Methylocaldum szegediense]|mgnify:CR=1 FL=1|uniref:Short chain amide porin n=1 Tax=Methylocaldum szegediense TaxID=73780 RepID=A0ABM9I615_9GAMM|nr:hypothetical protein [Methylocaldum szegediense]CAI8915154.1 conserved protein of unknown function [Methylocaldum szegediense]